MAQPRVALALGGGGARGYAHIGVIEVLEERGYDIVAIAGTSMGALVGGLHAAGSLGAYADWVRTLTQRDVLRLLDPSLRAPGVIRLSKIFARVSELLGDQRIEDLPIAFTAVATDLLAGKEVWFQRGPLAPAIRASIALPSFITPVMLDGRLLADGGLMNPVPVAPTAAVAADLTIAVSLAEEHLVGNARSAVSASTDPDDGPPQEDRRLLPGLRRLASTQAFDHELLRTVTSWISNLRDPSPAGGGADDPEPDEPQLGPLPQGLRTLEVMQLSLDALQGAVTRFRLAAHPPDLLITVPRTACRTLDFHRAGEMIALGRERAVEALERHERAMGVDAPTAEVSAPDDGRAG